MAEQKGIKSSVSHSEEKKNEDVIGSDTSPKHVKETHGTSDDIDENTPSDEVKGPSVIQRVKEEIEAVAEAIIHPKK